MLDLHSSSRFWGLVYKFEYCTYLNRASFISTTPDIMFMLSYGITQSIYSRWDARTISAFNRASGDYRLRRVTVQLDESMGFGQVTPLLLLILPLLAAAEIFYGESFATVLW